MGVFHAMTNYNLRQEWNATMSKRPHVTSVFAIRRKSDGLYFSDIPCDFFPLHPLALFESRSRAEGRVSIYLDEDERAGVEIVEFALTEVAHDGPAHTDEIRG